MKCVLVTTDFSELGDQALAPAGELAEKLGATLVVAHVLGGERPPQPDPSAPYFTVAQRLFEADEEMVKQTLASLQERGEKAFGNLEWKAAVARGAPVEGILALAESEGADLVVTSSQGRTGLSRIFLGSVAEELARLSKIPVLIWKSPKPVEESE